MINDRQYLHCHMSIFTDHKLVSNEARIPRVSVNARTRLANVQADAYNSLHDPIRAVGTFYIHIASLKSREIPY